MSERQKDLILSLSVVVGGGLIIWTFTEVVVPTLDKTSRNSFLSGTWFQLSAFAVLVLIGIFIAARQYGKRWVLEGKWELEPGQHQSDFCVMKRGQVLAGTAWEDDGLDFDLLVMNPDQANAFEAGDRKAGTLRKYSGKSRYKVKWTAPEGGTYHVVVHTHRRHKRRAVNMDMRVDRGEDRVEGLSDGEATVLRGLKKVKKGRIVDVAEKCRLTPATASKHLKSLHRKGMVRKEGKPPNQFWSPK